jgi:hypothetical protein
MTIAWTDRLPKRRRVRAAGIKSAAAKATLLEVIAAGVEVYDRERHLPRLLPLEPKDLEDSRPEARRAILARLARALRAERNRGRAGHWTYDLNRHIGLRQAYAAERQLLAEMHPGRRGKTQ